MLEPNALKSSYRPQEEEQCDLPCTYNGSRRFLFMYTSLPPPSLTNPLRIHFTHKTHADDTHHDPVLTMLHFPSHSDTLSPDR